MDTPNIIYAINIPKGTKKLEMLALARTDGGTNSNGTVSVSMMDDGSYLLMLKVNT